MVVNEYFGSWSAFVDAADRRADRYLQERGAIKADATDDWDLGAGWDGALKLARAGWPAGLARVKPLADCAAKSVQKNVRGLRLQYDVAGACWDVGRLVAGEPEPGLTFVRAPVAGRVARVVVTGGASGKIAADCYWRRGAAIVALCDVLENSGVRCEVVLGFENTPLFKNDDKDIDISKHGITIKRSEDALDLDLMAFALCHPATLRRLSFAVREGLPRDWRRKFGFGVGKGGYGHTETYKPDNADADNDIVVGRLLDESVWSNDEQMVDWIKKQVAGFVDITE